MASRPPGGRNAAAYTAGLKAGSLLGAARATPGAELAAAAWTDEAVEQALIDAAQQNGYVDKDGESEARRAIRSGLRNGLRSPRTLPDFAATRQAPAAQPQPRPAAPRRARLPQSQPPPPGIEVAERTASTTSPGERQDAGTTAPQPDSPRMRANRAAVAANQAYRAGDLDAARQFVDQAAALDPSRAGLWQQHQEQIAARRLILAAQAAHADGDHQRVQDLLGQARQLDPRLPAIWDGDLPGLPPARTARHSREHAATLGPDGLAGGIRPVDQGTGTRHRARTAAAPVDWEVARPSWPESPARVEPNVPAPRTSQEIGHGQPVQPGDATAAREPRAGVGIAAADTQPGAEAADENPSTRWPAPNPRVARTTSPPNHQGSHLVAESQATERPGPAADTEVGGTTTSGRPAVPPDWRNQILAAARQPWQPSPSQPRDPSPSMSPERQASSAGLEPDA